MRITIDYRPDEKRLAELIQAFSKGLCKDIPLEIIFIFDSQEYAKQ